MEFMAEWKSLWPVSSTFSAPLLIPDNHTLIGPITFTPNPTSSTTLLHSSSLSPRLPPPYPQLTLPGFLENYDCIPSSAASISSVLGPQLPNWSSEFHGFNSLQMLQLPKRNLIIVFFPAGENSDHVGFSLLSAKGGSLGVRSSQKNFFHVVKEGKMDRQRIKCLLVNPVDESCCNENEDDMFGHARNIRKCNNAATVGFLMVCTNYSVYWYRVGITSVHEQNEEFVYLNYVGCANNKMLRGNTVVSACWSPHLIEECLILLESGDLLLFDVNCSSAKKANSVFSVSGNNRLVGKKMQVSLSDKLGLRGEKHYEAKQWFGCVFSWHPRLFIVCHRSEILLVDLRSAGECNVSSLLKLESLSMRKNDGFLSLSRAGSDGFYFTAATRYLLLLCDVRKPLMPVLQWAHSVQNPRHMSVFRLSELRANPKDTSYKLATESGYCVILGSFWDNNFSLFCYGPDPKGDGSICSAVSKFCNPYYAWGLPSELSLSGSDCKCGSCLVGEEFWRASLRVWTDWRHKKDLILGFGILKPDIFANLSSLDCNDGFMLIRLTSSGKLEAQSYVAEMGSRKFPGAGHKRKSISLEDKFLYDCNYSEYDGKKNFQHLNLEFLEAYLKDKLAKYIVERREKINESDEDAQNKHAMKSMFNYHQEKCPKMKAFRLTTGGSSLELSDLLKHISWPISIHEIALKSACAALSTNLLQLAFSTYKDFDEYHEPLEFLDIPDHLQAPPFPFRKPSNRSNKWSSKVKPSDALVGPILPPHFLTTLHMIWMEELKDEKDLYLEESEAFSAHSQFKLQCDNVLEAVWEHISDSDVKTQEECVSLGDDTEDLSYETQKFKLACHKPSAFLRTHLSMDLKKSDCENDISSTHVFRRNQELAFDLNKEMVGQELFDVGCPIELNFGDCSLDFRPNELEIFRDLKKQDLEFQKKYEPYQKYIATSEKLR